MTYVMCVHGSAIEWFEPPKFLAEFDVDANDGYGTDRLVDDPREAMTFADLPAVFEAWTAQSTVHPIRLSDGKPNKPLTKYSIQPMPLADAIAGRATLIPNDPLVRAAVDAVVSKNRDELR